MAGGRAGAHVHRLLGMAVHAVTPAEVVERVLEMVEGGERGYLVFCTASSLLSARDDPRVRRALEEATLVCPDGMPLVWIGRRRGHRVERVYGPDFMVELMAVTGSRLRHFFFGGHQGIAQAATDSLRARFPQLEVAGFHSPPPSIDPMRLDLSAIDIINASGADVVWVGLGHPKQELWMHTHRRHLHAPVLAGVGAAFDFHAGAKKEAPQWMKRSGLQWLHRLAHEPRRLWRRYLIGNARFVSLVLVEELRRRERERAGGDRERPPRV